ncbi:MAG: PleD family two-component system response regulator [Candidatus Pacebacteria bacterium]|nr:PleD family two-component system response regulator [Candidatus Paceibacterota bacterium]
MPGRILIVDDIATNIKILEAKLEDDYYDIIQAESGMEALKLARIHSPDLIMLDIMMPEMDGFEVCRRLKADPETAHIPVIIVTALSELKDRIQGLSVGADDFLTKPVQEIPLLARIRSLIRLKHLIDMWRVREETSSQLGMIASADFLQIEAVNGKILVLSKIKSQSELIQKTLVKDGDQLEITDSIEQFNQKLASDLWELLIITIDIGKSETIKLISHIRSHSNAILRSVPILLLIGEEEREITAKALDFGISDYSALPIEPLEFLARVRTQLKRFRYQERLRLNYENSVAMAATDPLTGIYNRRYLDSHVKTMLSHSIAEKKNLSIAFCDLDHFKLINDSHGHEAGDEVLIEFCNRVQNNLRNFDLLARMGGEEFVILLPEANQERAIAIAERIRQLISETPFVLRNGTEIAVTVSIGISSLKNDQDSDKEMIDRADRAMYLAKQSGRNQVASL